ncbi:MAG: D-alanyl-D-alanine carboxypeptidase [Treponema sp.]|jgi:D-alanyl-D-alanine carboxypeptidase (penicillin-binding protein 5/6)|nr:D-alanyl-D-alanine carboxypeptidase [Treponema sp.]
MKQCAFFVLIFLMFSLASVFSHEPAPPPSIQSRSAIILDAETGAVLFTKNENEKIPPASLAKLMTMHIALSQVDTGNAALDEIVPLPQETWWGNQPPRSSLMFLADGQRVTLRELLLGLAISSGNDAAVAVSLRFASSVDAFVKLMNEEANRIGLENTVFTEPSGVSEHNMTTAAEFAVFCRYYLKAHPMSLIEYHSVGKFDYPKPKNMPEPVRSDMKTVTQYNHNYLLGRVEGVDGIKTGYIDESGYNIALTARRDDTRLIAVVLGAPAVKNGADIRDEDGRKLLEWAFSHFRTIRPDIGVLENVRVWKGRRKFAGLALGAPVEWTATADRGQSLHFEIQLNEPIIAPFYAGDVAGSLVFSDSIGELRTIPLVFTENVERAGFFKRLWDSICLFFKIRLKKVS